MAAVDGSLQTLAQFDGSLQKLADWSQKQFIKRQEIIKEQERVARLAAQEAAQEMQKRPHTGGSPAKRPPSAASKISSCMSLPNLGGSRAGPLRKRQVYSSATSIREDASTNGSIHGSICGSISTPSGKTRPISGAGLSGRFTADELKCFGHVPIPSPGFNISDWGFQSTLGDDLYSSRMTERSWSDVEEAGELLRRSPIHSHAMMLPQEIPTARVLDVIFPHDRNADKVVDSALSSTWSPQRGSSAMKKPSKSPTHSAAIVDDFAATAPARLVDSPGGARATTPLRPQTPGGSPISPGSKPSPLGNDSTTQATQGGSAIGKMQKFRTRMLNKFATVKSAFENFANETDEGIERELTRKQFSRFLNTHFQGLDKEEQNQIFDFLDGNGNGNVSMSEFQAAIEASAPVKNVHDLRRKWISLGYMSMRSAVYAMGWKPDNLLGEIKGNFVQKEYTLAEFGVALSRTGIDDPAEHLAMFMAIQDDRDKNGIVTLDQLVAAIATVSPPLLLEELREKLIRKFGALEEAYNHMTPEGDMGTLTRKSFNVYLEAHLDFSPNDAHKAFSFADVDGNGRMGRNELVGVLRLAEPNLFLEEVRKKVRQRYASISEVIKTNAQMTMAEDEIPPEEDTITGNHKKAKVKAMLRRAASMVDGSKSNIKNMQNEITEILKNVQFNDEDIKLLLNLLDVDGDKSVSPAELQRGMQIFAPSCVIDELRLHLLSKYNGIPQAFATVGQSTGSMVKLRHWPSYAIPDWKAMDSLFKELHVPESIPSRDLFCLLENRRTGGVNLSEIAVALRNVASGDLVPLTDEQRDHRASQQIHWQLAPFRKGASDLRGALRLTGDTELGEDTMLQKHSGGFGEEMEDNNADGSKKVRETIVYAEGHYASYTKVKEGVELALGTSKDTPGKKCVERVHGYYKNASVRMLDHNPVLGQSEHRNPQHARGEKHRRVLLTAAPLLNAAHEEGKFQR